MTTRLLGTLGKSGLAQGLSGWKGNGRHVGLAVSSEKQRLTPSSHLKDLVKNARALWNRLLQDPWGPADPLSKPVPLDEFSVVLTKYMKDTVSSAEPLLSRKIQIHSGRH